MVHGREPSAFLIENAGLLPRAGTALDIAAGEGRNAVFLATQGLDVIAIDISLRALEKCRQFAREQNVEVAVAAVDLKRFAIGLESFDCIVNFNYLQRDLAPQIIAALRPGGVLVFETLTREHLRWKPDFDPEFLLREGELAEMFRALRVVKYREATIEAGESFRSVAGIIARKE
jgi:SAM-dependent methyltransferase